MALAMGSSHNFETLVKDRKFMRELKRQEKEWRAKMKRSMETGA